MKNYEEFKKVIKGIESSRAYKIDSEAYKLENSFKVMVINFGYLRDVIYRVPPIDARQHADREKFMIEATRCFVNYLCSAGAFKDHTRRYIRKIYDETDVALGGEYQNKVNNEFLNDPLAQFIESIRNVYCHYEIPPLGILTKEKDGKFVSRFMLFTKDINLNSDFFNEKSREFIESLSEDTIDVLIMSEKYLHKTMFPWIMKEQSELHKEEFDRLEKLKKKARNLLVEE